MAQPDTILHVAYRSYYCSIVSQYLHDSGMSSASADACQRVSIKEGMCYDPDCICLDIVLQARE